MIKKLNKKVFIPIGIVLGIIIIILCVFGLKALNNKPQKKPIDYYASIPVAIKDSKNKLVGNLLKEVPSNQDVRDILKNYKKYPMPLIELAGRHSETINFVDDYKDRAKYLNKSISIKDDYKKGEIPSFIQWDKRWGYAQYGDGFMALNGCGPTSLSMIIVGLTGNLKANPLFVGNYAMKNKFYFDGVGTKWSLMIKGANHFGVKSRYVKVNVADMEACLKKGEPMIASVGPGVFTTTGHFIVLRGITKDNKILVNDPDSIAHTNESWSPELIVKEARAFWVFSK